MLVNDNSMNSLYNSILERIKVENKHSFWFYSTTPEYQAEDIEYEIIEPKQLPNNAQQIK